MKEPDAMTIYPWLQSEYETPSAWATAMVKGGRTGKVAVNGWSAIKIPIQQDATLRAMFDGQSIVEVSLDILRKRYLADMVEGGSGQTEGDPTQAASAKAAALERKKRKRPSTRPSETAGLRISTQARTSGQKAKSEKPRPRKRTMSDLSGMVSSELLQDRQLHFEAAGALFAMQDTSPSSAYGSLGRRSLKDRKSQRKSHRSIGFIPLESLARRRQEQGSTISALQIVKAWSAAPAASPQHSSPDVAQNEQCVVCGTSGDNTSHLGIPINDQSSEQHSTPEDSKTGSSDASADKGQLRRCHDCQESYHFGCIPSDILQHDPWRCPRCTSCSLCRKSIHEYPSKSTLARGIACVVGDDEIQVLSCYGCQKPTHLHCQLPVEPSLKEALRTDTALEGLEWLCLDCRECVECGFRLLTEVEKDTAIESTTRSSQPAVEGRWTHGCVLCPSCTTLAEKGNICPLCCRVYQDDDYETPMIFCDGCSLWVHVACDKGLQESDYEELGEDSRKYFCPSCIPTPIPSPTHSSSSSMVSTVNSVERSPWLESCSYSSHHAENSHDSNRDVSPNNEDDWHTQGRRRKDDILDLIKAAKEISDSESQGHSPYSAYSPMFPSSHSRTVSASLESVAEVAAAEALLTIFSGTSTPVSSTPYTSYPPSPFEPPHHHPVSPQ
ncbi:Histone-lysine N-methyltransferase 2B [Mortierella polycephala]|uniref:Histone-lysine N-methyltransferase 2B n=1 Tax=Mortierella polycephala TaxID=41804 RepID=A0A9P6Q650_9FUNG|nr:Histone-lysine N-methyltransferase 2B [Mortierella polycephala]